MASAPCCSMQTIVEDTTRGEYICSSCGCVQMGQMLLVNSYTDVISEDSAHLCEDGLVPWTEKIPDKVVKTNSLRYIGSNANTMKVRICSYLRNLSCTYHFPNSCVAMCMDVFTNLDTDDGNIFNGKRMETMAIALLYVTSEICGDPYSISFGKEDCLNMMVYETDVSSREQKFQTCVSTLRGHLPAKYLDRLDDYVPDSTDGDHRKAAVKVGGLCSKLGLDRKFSARARKTLWRMQTRKHVPEKVLASLSIFLASEGSLTMDRVSAALDVPLNTLRDARENVVLTAAADH